MPHNGDMGATGVVKSSPFLRCGLRTDADQLTVLHLKRDLLIPTILRSEDPENEGYQEGKVTNTRFGSFPHSTLIDIPWGSQVRASAVDTGSRGRRGDEKSKKRKRADPALENGEETASLNDDNDNMSRTAVIEASSGFIHVLSPTPESWTASLPHRTQVVYTPDYSYILQRIRAKPGTRLLEAGAGSGSFTHAAARAVFNGYEGVLQQDLHPYQKGKIWSFEFHEQRCQKLKDELTEHGLDGLVELTHRDICVEGFFTDKASLTEMRVNAVFLDLPAPWLALTYLTRNINSPLDPCTETHICTFSPCIEQIQKTIATLRQFGWVEIEMVEIGAKRIEVRRERVGLQEEGLRGVNDSPATVDEALTRLRELENKSKFLRIGKRNDGEDATNDGLIPERQLSKQQRLKNIRDAQESRKLYKAGRLVTKAELELKTHTSYLVFAVLPRSWSEEDEQAAQDAYSNSGQNRQICSDYKWETTEKGSK